VLRDGQLAAQIAKLAIKADCQAISPTAGIARAVAIDPLDERRSIAHIDSDEPGIIFAAVVNRQRPMMQKRVVASRADKETVGDPNRIRRRRKSTVPALCGVRILRDLHGLCAEFVEQRSPRRDPSAALLPGGSDLVAV
jgi:hypothetical protein